MIAKWWCSHVATRNTGEAFQNVADFLALKLHGEVLSLGSSVPKDPGSASWISKISRGGLLEPTESWLKDAANLEEFSKYHWESDLDQRENVINGLS